MGDIADDLTETMTHAWAIHLAGECDEYCDFCRNQKKKMKNKPQKGLDDDA